MSERFSEQHIDPRNLGLGQRMVRAALAAGLLAAPFLHDQPLGLLSLLPLVAVYPGLTAFLGYDPLRAGAAKPVQEAANDPAYGEPPLRRAA